jgi:hypothetical protein
VTGDSPLPSPLFLARQANEYKAIEEFAEDITVMCKNAMTFNPPTNLVHTVGQVSWGTCVYSACDPGLCSEAWMTG